MGFKTTLTSIIASLAIPGCAHLSEPVKPDYCQGEEMAAGETKVISTPELYQCAEHYFERARLSELLKDRMEVLRYSDLALGNLGLIPAEERPADYLSLEKELLDLKGEARVGEEYR